MRNKMRFGIIMGIIICGLLTMGIVSAEIDETNLGSVKQNTCIEIPQVCGSCSYVNLTIYYPNKSRAITNDGMTSIGGSSWSYEFCNTSNLGIYYISGGGDVEGSLTGFDNYYFEVNPEGIDQNLTRIIANIATILFFVSLIFGVYIISRKIDYKSWQNSLVTKYSNRNYLKLVMGSLAFNVLKNSYVIYYLLGFPIFLAFMNLVFNFNIIGLLEIVKAMLIIYSVGAIIVAIYLFSHVQEWIMDLLEEIKNMEWGV